MMQAQIPGAPGAQAILDRLSGRPVEVVTVIDEQLAGARRLEPELKAFANLDEGLVRRQAERLASTAARGEALPPLFGVAVAVKDIIDTVDFPTALGSPIHAGRQAGADASVVRRLRDAGAVIFGKTVTTEFATLLPGPTRNPHHLAHTPGGSSSGSAAAVAAGIVPAALGTQTNGSVLRPASFCGVWGYKPTAGLVPRTGVFPQSPSLDQVGVFARGVEDLARVAEVLTGDDGKDLSTLAAASMHLLSVCRSTPAVPPRLGFARTPFWPQVDGAARAAYEAFALQLQALLTDVELPAIVEQTVPWLATVNEAELAVALRAEYLQQADGLSAGLRQRLERGWSGAAGEYLAARAGMAQAASALDRLFDRFDALVCPAALGGAPLGLASTGNPIMQTAWSFSGLPALSMPLLTLPDGLPLGVQIVGRRHDDARLFRNARWLAEAFAARGAA